MLPILITEKCEQSVLMIFHATFNLMVSFCISLFILLLLLLLLYPFIVYISMIMPFHWARLSSVGKYNWKFQVNLYFTHIHVGVLLQRRFVLIQMRCSLCKDLFIRLNSRNGGWTVGHLLARLNYISWSLYILIIFMLWMNST